MMAELAQGAHTTARVHPTLLGPWQSLAVLSASDSCASFTVILHLSASTLRYSTWTWSQGMYLTRLA